MVFARLFPIAAVALAGALAAPLPAGADEPAKVTVTLENHKFSPAEPTAPAGKPIVIEVVNRDGTPAEFEAKALRVEKVVTGGKTIAVNVHPLKPGRYRFFDDYNEATAEGFLVVH
jgi:heme/copper-type cytochrome/quinol oxidase subunit 2